jgi:hypothetical protein
MCNGVSNGAKGSALVAATLIPAVLTAYALLQHAPFVAPFVTPLTPFVTLCSLLAAFLPGGMSSPGFLLKKPNGFSVKPTAA